MDMGSIGMSCYYEGILAFGKTESQFLSQSVRFLRCDLSRLEGLTDLISNHFMPLAVAGDLLILALGQHGLLTFGKQLLCISFFIKTPAGCGDTVQPKLHGVEGLRLEGGDLGISHNDHCQSRCHYAANVQRLVIQA